MNVSGKNCAWTLERIDPYVDGELVGEELGSFEEHLARCDACRRELELAKSLVTELRALPELACPRRVVDEAAARAGAHSTGIAGRWRGRLRELLAATRVFVPRPAMAAVLIVIVAVAVFVLFQHEQSPFKKNEHVELTERDAELARVDVMLAFAYVGKYTRRTGEIVTEEVIGEKVMKPVERSVMEPMYQLPREQ